MPSLKDVKMKIVGVRKTKQITKAMNMVASAKLRGAQSRIERFRPYAEKFQAVLGDLAAKSDGSAHALLERRAECHVSVIILATSDRGLCGGEAYFFTRGAVQRGTWQKTSPEHPLKVYAADGSEMCFNRGKTYLAIVDDDEWQNFNYQ